MPLTGLPWSKNAMSPRYPRPLKLSKFFPPPPHCGAFSATTLWLRFLPPECGGGLTRKPPATILRWHSLYYGSRSSLREGRPRFLVATFCRPERDDLPAAELSPFVGCWLNVCRLDPRKPCEAIFWGSTSVGSMNLPPRRRDTDKPCSFEFGDGRCLPSPVHSSVEEISACDSQSPIFVPRMVNVLDHDSR